MGRKFTFLLLFFLILPAVILAQGRIKGKITDVQSGEPLIGANVVVAGTSLGAATDLRGEYVIDNLTPGTYTLKASYIGYQTITINNVRVNEDLTTETNFQLPAEGLTTGMVEVTAIRPLINKSNTNAQRITTAEDIEALPVRGVNNIIALSAGVVQKDEGIFIRGGRLDEVGYYLEGVSITNPIAGGRAVTLAQDAVEEIQVQAGGYSAEFGGANAGIIRQSLKSGGTGIKASLEYITDNIGFQSKDNAFDGKKRLGTYWYGYNEMSAVVSGPVVDPRFRFFFNLNYVYQRDQSPQSYPGLNFGPLVDKGTGDSINLSYPAGAVRGNSMNQYTFTGTVNLDFKPFLVRLSGVYTMRQDQASPIFRAQRWSGNIADFMNPRVGLMDGNNGTFNAKITHVINSNMFYEVSGGYFMQTREIYDPYLKDDFWSYGDSVANAAHGIIWERSAADLANPTKHGRYVVPAPRDVMGFRFTGMNDVAVNYSKFDRRSYTINGNLTYNMGSTHSFKVGGEFQQYIVRNWACAPNTGQTAFAGSLATLMASLPNASVDSLKKNLLLTNGVNNYGYDILGNKTDGDGFDAPHKPIFASGFIQDKIEYQDLILNLGLRYDYIDVDNLEFKDPTRPELAINKNTGELYPEGWQEVKAFSAVSPRLGFSFPITDKTVFHAQFGKFVQQTRLLDIYQGYNRTSFELRGGFFIPSPVGKNVKPTRTTQYELGFSQQLTDFMSVDVTGYYKDIKDQVVFTVINTANNSPFEDYYTLTNGDFATTKGVELTLNMRRYERIAMNATLAFQDARGTGSFPNSNRGIVGQPLEAGKPFNPQYISPLEFNNDVRANMNIDYRFGPDEGPSFLRDLGASVLVSYTSGHPYTLGQGGADLEGEARSRSPLEALNSSTTPATFQVDLRIDKTIRLYDRLSANIYINVINLFDRKNIENVFLRTGSTDDDGWISNPEEAAKLTETYGQQYVSLYRAINIDYYERYQQATGLQTTPFFYGEPRQIRLGIRLEY